MIDNHQLIIGRSELWAKSRKTYGPLTDNAKPWAGTKNAPLAGVIFRRKWNIRLFRVPDA